MAKSVNQKFLDATESAFYDMRFDVADFAIAMSRQPPVTQMQFVRLMAAYADVMAGYVDNGYVPFGMREVASAMTEIRGIMDEYFPEDDAAKIVRLGVEWEQI